MSRFILFAFVLSLQVTQIMADEATNASFQIQRETRDVVGWTLHIHSELQRSEPEATELAVKLLKKQLTEIVRVVPRPAVAELRKVPLYFSPTYPGEQARAEFHPGAGWLKEHGRDPVMEKSVEFSNIPIFEQETKRMPNFALHELAHAYHNIVLDEGFGNPKVIAAYDRAKQGKAYDLVEQWHGIEGKNTFNEAYGMSNPMEYFAESTEAFFTRNDFFPFNRSQLRKHDPDMVEVLIELWGVKNASAGKNAK